MLYVVATPIGNLGDISARAREILAAASAVAAEDTRHSGRLLRELGLERPLVSLHEHNERARVAELIARLQRGESIALVSDAGTPLVSDPGYLLVSAAVAAGIAVSPVPGANAAIAALSASGLPCDRFCFEGFLPARAAARRQRLAELAAEPRTLVPLRGPAPDRGVPRRPCHRLRRRSCAPASRASSPSASRLSIAGRSRSLPRARSRTRTSRAASR